MSGRHLRAAVAAVLVLWGTWLWFLAPQAAAPAGAAEGSAALLLQHVDSSAAPKVSVVVSPSADAVGATFDPAAFRVRVGDATVPVAVERLPGGDLDVMLVVDTSGSMAGAPIDAARVAAADFASRLPPSARVGVIGFGPTAAVVSPFGVDRAATTAAIGALTARGETALYDAVLLAARSFPTDGGGRRSIVLLSDGGDTASTATLDAAVGELGRSGARLDVVGLVTRDSDDEATARLATAGSGRVVPAGDPAALADVYGAVAQSLVNQYRLTFTMPGSGRAVARVELDQGGATATADVAVDLPGAPAPPPPVARPQPVEAPQPAPAWTTSRWVLLVGAGAFFLALLLVGASTLVSPRHRSRRLARLGHVRHSEARSATVSDLAQRVSAAAERALDRQGRRVALNVALERAGIALRPGEFAVLTGSLAFGAQLIGLLLGGLLVGALLGGIVVLGCRAVVNHLAQRRQARFAGQLGDTLQLLSGSLRAGYGLVQAVDSVAREADSPTADEFRRVVVETRLGRDLSSSLAAMAARVGGDDFTWVVQAIDIHREIGGDLAEVLDTVAETIRERDQLRRQVQALTAEGRLSAYILTGLPVFLLVILSTANPEYAAEFTRGAGVVMSVVGVGLMAVGAVWFKKLIRLRY